MPIMTASTMTLMPDDTTLPSTRSARKLVLFHSANGTSTKPANAVSLNSRIVMKSWMARMKKASTTSRSEEHTSELQSLMRISYAVFCLKKETKKTRKITQQYHKQTEENNTKQRTVE